jgi:hypothetical protein
MCFRLTKMRIIFKYIVLQKILKNRMFLIIAIFLLSSLPAFSQFPDSIRVLREKPEKLLKNLRIKNVTQGGFNFWHDDFTGHWAGIDFGFNTLTGKDLSDTYPDYLEHDIFRSNSLFINIMQQSISLQQTRNTIGLVTGLGIQFKSYRLNNNTTIEVTPSGKIGEKILIYDVNQKSKFSMAYITAPLLIEFQVPVNQYSDRLFISGGLMAGYRLNSHTKIKYRADRRKEKLKTPGDYSLNDFKYGFMMRLGYRQYQVFANYDITPFFKEEALAPDIFPFTFGFTLLSF